LLQQAEGGATTKYLQRKRKVQHGGVGLQGNIVLVQYAQFGQPCCRLTPQSLAATGRHGGAAFLKGKGACVCLAWESAATVLPMQEPHACVRV
jgi:hypothetical protein